MSTDDREPFHEAPHVFVVSGRRGGEFCSKCGLHWTDECHTRSMAVVGREGANR